MVDRGISMKKEFRHCVVCGEIVVRDSPDQPWKICFEHQYPNEYHLALANGDVDPMEILYCNCGCRKEK